MIIEKFEITNVATNETKESEMYVFDSDEAIDWDAMGIGEKSKSKEEVITGFTLDELLTCNKLEDIVEAMTDPDCFILINPAKYTEFKKAVIENLYAFERYCWEYFKLLPQPQKKTLDNVNVEIDFMTAWDNTIRNHLFMEVLDWNTIYSYCQKDEAMHSCDSPYMLDLSRTRSDFS